MPVCYNIPMTKSSDKTNAMRLLDAHKASYIPHYIAGGEALSATEAASELGIEPERVFKTLVTVGRSGTHYVFMLPALAELDLKKAAACAGEKSVEMIKSRELLPLTGYIHGGCSPISMKKTFPTFIDRSAENCGTIIFSAGRIGCHIETELIVLREITGAKSVDISAYK